MNRSLALLPPLLLALAAIPTGSIAAPLDQFIRVVTYSDEDLSSPSRVAALHRRIEHSINQVCADASGPSPTVTVDPFCKADAWANIRAQMETRTASRGRKDQTAYLIRIPEPVRTPGAEPPSTR